MKFALVEGEKLEAQPGLAGRCQRCGNPTLAKCGKLRIWHWAHRGNRSCDPWWESETQWHRDWKDLFPVGWQERMHAAENGEKHIADVKTDAGVVLEFQHSPISSDERQSRERFYRTMVWVVDGRRRVRDRTGLFRALGAALSENPLVIHGNVIESALLRDWKDSLVPVYFDFGESEPDDRVRFNAPMLWRLHPGGESSLVYLSPVPKAEFLRYQHQGENFEELYTQFLTRALAMRQRQQASPVPLPGFQRHQFRQALRRRRL